MKPLKEIHLFRIWALRYCLSWARRMSGSARWFSAACWSPLCCGLSHPSGRRAARGSTQLCCMQGCSWSLSVSSYPNSFSWIHTILILETQIGNSMQLAWNERNKKWLENFSGTEFQDSGKQITTLKLTDSCVAVCQSLRILSFTVTTLPSPNYHCRSPRETAVAPWPSHWWGHVLVNLKKQVGNLEREFWHSCCWMQVESWTDACHDQAICIIHGSLLKHKSEGLY